MQFRIVKLVCSLLFHEMKRKRGPSIYRCHVIRPIRQKTPLEMLIKGRRLRKREIDTFDKNQEKEESKDDDEEKKGPNHISEREINYDPFTEAKKRNCLVQRLREEGDVFFLLLEGTHPFLLLNPPSFVKVHCLPFPFGGTEK